MAEAWRRARTIFSPISSSRIFLSGVKNKPRVCLLSNADAAYEVPIFRKPWRIFAAVSLERRPVLSKELTNLEQRFENYQSLLEIQHSALSNYEVRRRDIEKGSRTSKKKLTEAEEQKRLDYERQLARIVDEEEEIKAEVQNLVCAERVTQADVGDDHSSLDRKLDETLHLVTKCDNQWLLPETELADGENLRQAAERILHEYYKTEIPVLFLSNAPSGVHTIEFDSSQKKNSESQGKKIFFYKAILQTTTELPALEVDFKWITVDEMQNFIPNDYYRQITRFTS